MYAKRVAVCLLGMWVVLEASSAAAQPARVARSRVRVAARPAVKRLYNPRAPTLPDGPLLTVQDTLHVSKTQYTDLRRAGTALLERFPPDRHFFIGLGRDPAPIIAFLQNIRNDLAMNLPASGKKFHESKELDRHFAELLPPHVLESGRTLVLIDQTSSGRTLQVFSPFLRAYLERIGAHPEIRLAAFSPNGMPQGIEHFDTGQYAEVSKFLYPPYEGVISEHERHVPGAAPLSELRRRPVYDAYRAALKERMIRDAELDQVLAAWSEQRTAAPVPPLRRLVRRGDAPVPAGPMLRVEHGGVVHQHLSEVQYRDLAAGSKELLRRYPLEDYYYLGAGQTSAPLVAFLQNLGGRGVADYVPVDGMMTLDARGMDVLRQFLESRVPPEVRWGRQRLLLFQQAWVAAAPERLREAVRQALPAAVVEVVALSDAPLHTVPTIDTSGRPELQRLDHAAYRAIAPYPYHRVGEMPFAQLRLNRAFLRYRRALRRRMAEDGDLAELSGGQPLAPEARP